MTGNEQVMHFGSGEHELRIELLLEPEEYGLTGTIEGKILPGLLGIRLDETPQTERSYEVGALLKLKESKHAVINLVPEILARLRDEDTFALFTVFHETGHYVHQHYLKRTGTAEENDEKRKAFIEAGSVHPDELEADAFAAAYLGTEKTITGLKALEQYMLDHYPKEEWDPEDRSLMSREIEMRIGNLAEAVNSLQTLPPTLLASP